MDINISLCCPNSWNLVKLRRRYVSMDGYCYQPMVSKQLVGKDWFRCQPMMTEQLEFGLVEA